MANACVKKADKRASPKVIFKSEFMERSSGSPLNLIVAKPGKRPSQLENRINKKKVITIGKKTLAFWLPAKSETVVYPKSIIISNKFCKPEGTSCTFQVARMETVMRAAMVIQLTRRVLVTGKFLKYPSISGCSTIPCSTFFKSFQILIIIVLEFQIFYKKLLRLVNGGFNPTFLFDYGEMKTIVQKRQKCL